ncbi:MAG: YicC family protein [Crocinitomicaceae bacterium]|nr:YicC family protein [Crocinitomicaceae bacterium]
MIRSMTGFGKASGEFEGKKITVEIKSLNSKTNDTKMRLPSSYRDKELIVRNRVAAKLDRGKIDVFISIENVESSSAATINQLLAKGYYKQLKELSTELDEGGDFMDLVMKMPGVLENLSYEADPEEWNAIVELIDQALVEIDTFRTEEGKQLETDLVKRLDNISTYLKEIQVYAPQRIEEKREKLLNRFKENEEDLKSLDQNRFEQELIYYLEKLDITEEEVRLNTHLDYFRKTMDSGKSQGKKLGFISQEMGREINTIGSKSNHAGMQKHVVQMKDELEKIKEQVLNIL